MLKYFLNMFFATFMCYSNISYAQTPISPLISLSFNSNSFNVNNDLLQKINNFPYKSEQIISLDNNTTLKIYKMDTFYYLSNIDKTNEAFKNIDINGNFSHSNLNYNELSSHGLALISSQGANSIYDKNHTAYLESSLSINKSDYILEVTGQYKNSHPDINITINKITNKGNIDETYKPIKLSLTPNGFYTFVMQSQNFVNIGQLHINKTTTREFTSGDQSIQIPYEEPL